MKLRVVRPVAADVQYRDADTGRFDTVNKQASEPIRVLSSKIELKPVTEKDIEYLRKVLNYSRSSKLKYLAELVDSTDDETTDAFIQRGDDFIVEYYKRKLEEQRRAAWEEKG